MSKVKNVFICAPYRADSIEGVRQNIVAARQVAIEVAKLGFYPVCPHLNTALFDFEPELSHVDDEVYLEGCRNMLAGCDAILFMSMVITQGMAGELDRARHFAIPMFTSLVALQNFKDL